MNILEQFADDILVMNDNAEQIMGFAETTTNLDRKQTLSGFALTLKGQAVLAEMLMEVLKSQQQTP